MTPLSVNCSIQVSSHTEEWDCYIYCKKKGDDEVKTKITTSKNKICYISKSKSNYR